MARGLSGNPLYLATPQPKRTPTTSLSTGTARTAPRPAVGSGSLLVAHVSSQLAQVCGLSRQKDVLTMLLEDAQTKLLLELEALRIARAHDSSWWRALEYSEQVLYLRREKEARDFQVHVSAALSVVRRLDTAVIWAAGGGKSHILHMVGACSPGQSLDLTRLIV